MNNKIELTDVERAVDMVKLNSLYLELIELHKEAIRFLEKKLEVDNYYLPVTQAFYSEQYDKKMQEIARVHLQIVFLKIK